MGTFIVGLCLSAVVWLIIRSMLKDHKNGKSSCGCNCSNCPKRCQ